MPGGEVRPWDIMAPEPHPPEVLQAARVTTAYYAKGPADLLDLLTVLGLMDDIWGHREH